MLKGVVLVTAALFLPGVSAADTLEEATQLLMGRLDLDRPGLSRVRAASGDPGAAAEELLAYYRTRKGVRHPLDRGTPKGRSPKALPERIREIADDALKNILIASPSYPRHDFGPDIDWHANRNAKRDREWLWQLHRHSSWGALGRAYRHTGDERYARRYVRQLLDWIRKCPLDTDKGRHTQPAWRRIEAGIRGYGWTHHFCLFLRSPSFTPEALVRFLNACSVHASYLTEKFSYQNHGLMEAEGSAFIAIIFPEFRDSARWRRKAFAHLNKQIHVQVRPDGHQVEQCFNYHLGCIGWFSRTAELAALNGMADEFPPPFWKRIEAMAEVPLKLGFPDGTSAQFGDTHSSMRWRHGLRKWSDLFKRDDMLYAATGGRRGTQPEATAFALPTSGFYSMRSDWSTNATCLVLRCGPGGYWHSQPDNGTFEIFAGGRRLTPDSGTYIYSGDERGRRRFRQTRLHQTLTLDGRDAAQKARLLLWKPGDERDTLVVENDSYRGCRHRRALFFVRKQYFVLVDEALGTTPGNAMLHFQLAPGEAALDKSALSARTGFPRGTNLLIQARPQAGLSMRQEPGIVSFHYGQKESRPAFRFELKKDKRSVRFVTLLVPFRERTPEAGILSVTPSRPGSSALEIEARVNGRTDHLAYRLD
jgi:heparan-sulfate lyase